MPVEFGLDRNVAWKISLPGGYSSPVVAGDKIFVTAFEKDDLLRKHRPDFLRAGRKRALEGAARSVHLVLWHWTSLVIADGKIVMLCDADVDSFLLAVPSQDGKQIWKTPRPGAIVPRMARHKPSFPVRSTSSRMRSTRRKIVVGRRNDWDVLGVADLHESLRGHARNCR